MPDFLVTLHALIGESGQQLTLAQMLTRALIIVLAGLLFIRLGAPRLFGRATPIDIVLAVVIGSNLSRTMTGNAPFLEVMAVTACLILFHSLLTRLALDFRPLAHLLKGKARVLAKDGEIDWKTMRSCAVGKHDLLGAVRAAGGTTLDQIRLATLERGGDIEVILSTADE